MPTLFERIIAREIPATILFEDDQCIAFADISPRAPVHFLVVPRKVIPTINDITETDEQTIGHLFRIASQVAKQQGHTDFRAVINCGPGAQQTVFHLHVHILAGREFTWPPG